MDRSEIANGIVAQYEPLVRKLARFAMAKLPSSVSFEDLVQVGRIAVWECSERFDAGRGGTFETCVTRRIIGSLFDHLREMDVLSRHDRKKVQKLRRVMNGSSRIDRSALAREMGIDLSELERLLVLLSAGHSESGDDPAYEDGSVSYFDLIPSENGDPLDALRLQDCIAVIDMAIAKCFPGEVEVAELVFEKHFLDGRDLAEIGDFLGVTESRVCQIADGLRRFVLRGMRHR